MFWSFIGICLLVGLLSSLIDAVSAFVSTHTVLIISVGVVLLFLVIIVDSLRKNMRKSQYKPISLISFINLSDNEKLLYNASLILLESGIKEFSPHDLGSMGFDTTATYYKNLYDKGYFDKPQRGVYRINRERFNNALSSYNNTIDNYVLNASTVKFYKSDAEKTIKQYMYDKQNILVNNTQRLSAEAIYNLFSE